LLEKKRLADGNRSAVPQISAIIVQDFSHFDTENGNKYQVLIVSCHTHNPTSSDHLARKYRICVGNQEHKNDVRFVISAWLKMAEEDFFGTPGLISVWSDGGGQKHFKQAPNLVFMSVVFQEHFRAKWRFVYNFFPSYHGDGICDGMAANLKRHMKSWEKDNSLDHHHYILSAETLTQVLRGMHNTTVSTIEIASFPNKTAIRCRQCLGAASGTIPTASAHQWASSTRSMHSRRLEMAMHTS
jgi:hypothetical protein